MELERTKVVISGSVLGLTGTVPLGILSAVILRGVVNNLIIKGLRFTYLTPRPTSNGKL
jgi:hypothetical protein